RSPPRGDVVGLHTGRDLPPAGSREHHGPIGFEGDPPRRRKEAALPPARHSPDADALPPLTATRDADALVRVPGYASGPRTVGVANHAIHQGVASRLARVVAEHRKRG